VIARCLPLLVALSAVALGGCATREFSMRTLPAETPAADNAAAIKQAEQLAQAAAQR